MKYRTQRTTSKHGCILSRAVKELDLPLERLPDQHMMSLLVETKRGATEVSKMMFDCPGANFALVNSVSSANGHASHTVTVRVESVRLSEFWVWLWVEKREALMREGLLAVMMQTGTIVWCQARIEGKGLMCMSSLMVVVVVCVCVTNRRLEHNIVHH